MMNFLVSHSKWIIGIYLILTLIKLFTATIGRQIEEDPTIYIKFYPTITNHFNGANRDIERYESKYSWYANNQYWKLVNSNGNFALGLVIGLGYTILIFLWWVLSAGFVFFAIYKLLK